MAKDFLTQNQQVDLLISRGLLINDREMAIQKLQSINYYRFNAYFHQFLNENTFIPGTSFDVILSAYEMDRKLRQIFLEHLEELEIKARCQLSHELGRFFGPLAFYECSNFNNAAVWEELQESFNNEINRDKKDPVAEHYYTDYDGQFEIWVIVEYLSFGDLSRLFSISNNEIQKAVAKSFNVHETLLKSWLKSLSILRNICAHYGYLRKREFSIAPAIPKSVIYQVGNNRQLFSLVIALSWLIDKNRKIELIETLHMLDNDWANYGFIENWENVLLS